MSVTISIVQLAGAWRGLQNGYFHGGWDNRCDAVDAALEPEGGLRRDGRDVELLVQTEFGELARLNARTALALGLSAAIGNKAWP